MPVNFPSEAQRLPTVRIPRRCSQFTVCRFRLAFGATTTTTTAAPAQTGFLFGSTPVASAAPTGLNSTFTFGTPTANAAAPTATATQPLTFGSTLQNSTAIRPFGSTTAFGSAATATTPAAGTTGFGGTSLFGATQPAAQTTSLFGATQPAFGAAQPAQATNIFGAPVGAATQVGTTVKFEAVAGQGTFRLHRQLRILTRLLV